MDQKIQSRRQLCHVTVLQDYRIISIGALPPVPAMVPILSVVLIGTQHTTRGVCHTHCTFILCPLHSCLPVISALTGRLLGSPDLLHQREQGFIFFLAPPLALGTLTLVSGMRLSLLWTRCV